MTGPAAYPRRSACGDCGCVARVSWTADDPPVSLLAGCECAGHPHEDGRLATSDLDARPARLGHAEESRRWKNHG